MIIICANMKGMTLIRHIKTMTSAMEFAAPDYPIKKWEYWLLHYQMITAPFSKVAGRQPTGSVKERTWTICIMIFLLSQIFRCSVLLSLDNELEPSTRMTWGTIYYHLGVPGKVIYIISVSGAIQMLLMRILFSVQERGKKLDFLGDIHSYSNKNVRMTLTRKEAISLKGKFREKFLRMAMKKLTSSHINRYLTAPIAVGITLSGTIYYVIHESRATGGMSVFEGLVWFFWFSVQTLLQYFGIYTATLVLGFWFVCRLHLDIMMEQAIDKLDQTIKCLTPNRDSHQDGDEIEELSIQQTGKIRRNFNEFVLLIQGTNEKVVNFDKFSRWYLMIVQFTSCVISSAVMLVTILSKSPIHKVLLGVGWFIITAPPVGIMRSATRLNQLSYICNKKCHECSVRMSRVRESIPETIHDRFRT